MSKKKRYANYIGSSDWIDLKSKVCDLYHFKCKHCRKVFTKDNLVMRHKFWGNQFKEEPKDMTILCFPCNESYNEQKKKNKQVNKEQKNKLLKERNHQYNPKYKLSEKDKILQAKYDNLRNKGIIT